MGIGFSKISEMATYYISEAKKQLPKNDFSPKILRLYGMGFKLRVLEAEVAKIDGRSAQDIKTVNARVEMIEKHQFPRITELEAKQKKLEGSSTELAGKVAALPTKIAEEKTSMQKHVAEVAKRVEEASAKRLGALEAENKALKEQAMKDQAVLAKVLGRLELLEASNKDLRGSRDSLAEELRKTQREHAATAAKMDGFDGRLETMSVAASLPRSDASSVYSKQSSAAASQSSGTWETQSLDGDLDDDDICPIAIRGVPRDSQALSCWFGVSMHLLAHTLHLENMKPLTAEQREFQTHLLKIKHSLLKEDPQPITSEMVIKALASAKKILPPTWDITGAQDPSEFLFLTHGIFSQDLSFSPEAPFKSLESLLIEKYAKTTPEDELTITIERAHTNNPCPITQKIKIGAKSYNLTAVAVWEHGHYIAYSFKNNIWWQCNDERVSQVINQEAMMQKFSTNATQIIYKEIK